MTWSGPELPKTNYEVSLEAMKIDGSDFFCGIAFPVGKQTASFVAGGWGGGVCGISSIDGSNASENETSLVKSFAKDKWYRFRLRVEPEKILVWLDDEKIIDVAIKGREVVRTDGSHAYIVFPDGVGRSRLTHDLIERKLGTRGTGRNWNTVLKLGALAAD